MARFQCKVSLTNEEITFIQNRADALRISFSAALAMSVKRDMTDTITETNADIATRPLAWHEILFVGTGKPMITKIGDNHYRDNLRNNDMDYAQMMLMVQQFNIQRLKL